METACSLKRVAALAGVSTMTVSRVMRNSSRVSSVTKARVLAAAGRLGYRPDPIASRLMAVVRQSKRGGRNVAAIAFIRDRRGQISSEVDVHRYVHGDQVARRAEMHGYAVDEFFLGEGGLTPARLQTVLAARGIEGVLYSTETLKDPVSVFDFSRFASSTFGYGLQNPSLHRAGTNMMQGLLAALRHLEERGYRKIGLAITPWVNDRSDHTYSGAMLNYQVTVARRYRVPPLIFRSNRLSEGREEFCSWARLHKPDALISFDRLVPDWLRKTLGRRTPEDIGFVVHDWTECARGFAGIDHHRADVAAAAVDLVANQLYHSEIGTPRVPRQILVPATWVEGESC